MYALLKLIRLAKRLLKLELAVAQLLFDACPRRHGLFHLLVDLALAELAAQLRELGARLSELLDARLALVDLADDVLLVLLLFDRRVRIHGYCLVLNLL